MNRVILMGRLTRDPDIRYTQGERSMAIARYTLAVDRRGAGTRTALQTSRRPILSIVSRLTGPPSLPRSISARECGCLYRAGYRREAM